jgi:hypothetical protein
MPGARCTRSLAWEEIEPHECRHREVHRETPGIPARNGFNGLLRDLPGDRALLSPSPANWFAGPGRADTPPRDLTPASRRQDHTTSPSAHALFVDRALGSLTGDPPCNPLARQRCRGHRILPRVRDDRDTPLSVGQDGAAYKSDLGETRSEKYLHMGLDRGITERPVGQITYKLLRVAIYNASHATALSLMALILVNSRVTFSSSKSFSGPVGAMSVKGTSYSKAGSITP